MFPCPKCSIRSQLPFGAHDIVEAMGQHGADGGAMRPKVAAIILFCACILLATPHHAILFSRDVVMYADLAPGFPVLCCTAVALGSFISLLKDIDSCELISKLCLSRCLRSPAWLPSMRSQHCVVCFWGGTSMHFPPCIFSQRFHSPPFSSSLLHAVGFERVVYDLTQILVEKQGNNAMGDRFSVSVYRLRRELPASLDGVPCVSDLQ